MATPDVSTLTSSSQIFASHTLPQIRAIHKALHVQIDDKAARLRTQVGGSYRELLGTADTIVRMRGDMDGVQATLGQMGARCGRTVVGAKVAGLGRFVRDGEGAGSEGALHLGVLARVKLLGACALVFGRTLRPGVQDGTHGDGGAADAALGRGDRLVLAAKVFVLSRLLVKSLGDGIRDRAVSEAVEQAKRTLGHLRSKLLRSVDKLVESTAPQWKQEDILKALSAYSLATNSGAKDVLRHFLRVRGDAMVLAFEVGEDERERRPADVVKCMELYTKTMLSVQGLAPHKLTEALLGLKKTALLADDVLRQVEALRLDIYETWSGDEIQYFTPFIRHDDLDISQAREMLGRWSSEGGEILLQGLDKTLERITEFKAIAELRTTVLRVWISDGGRAKGFDASVMMDRIREVISRRMLDVLDQKANRLRLVGSEVSATLDAWREGTSDEYHGLWDEGGIDTDLANGAGTFTQDVISRLYGRNDPVSKAVNCYHSWHHIIGEVSAVVEQLRRQRWDNDMDEIEDEETIEQRQTLLSKTDPQMLHDHLATALVEAFKSLDMHLTALWDRNKDGPRSGPVAMYFTRMLRDFRAQLPKMDGLQRFGLGLVPSLYRQIVATVATPPLNGFANAALARESVVGRSLWEGEPALPTTPSPGSFRFLRDTVTSMADAGMDLWSPFAVAQLKQHLGERLCQAWLEAVDSHIDVGKRVTNRSAEPSVEPRTELSSSESGNESAGGKEQEQEDEDETLGETAASPNGTPQASPENKRDLLIQWMFDLYYLRCGLQTSVSMGSSSEPWDSLEAQIYACVGVDMPADFRERLTRASRDYWKRTSLLFGLLA